MTTLGLFVPLALALCATPANAQYYWGNDTGSSYGTRIGVGVGIAVAVALIILLVGFFMRRRRARAFKTAFPLQQVQPGAAEQGHAHGYYGQQWNGQPQTGGAAQPQYGQQYVPSPAAGADQPPPQYANYRQDTQSHYAPPPVPPPMSSHPSSHAQTHYAPPSSPPPMAGGSAPPTHDASGKALSGEEREAWQAAQEARERELAGGK